MGEESAESSTEFRVQSTEDGKMAVQRCKSAYGLCKGAKVKRERNGGPGGAFARIAGRRRFACHSANGRDAVAPLPEAAQPLVTVSPCQLRSLSVIRTPYSVIFSCQPLPAIRLGQHAVLPLPDTGLRGRGTGIG